MKTFSLDNHSALVTGSSKGIGLGIARGLLDAGAKVVFHGLEPEPSDLPSTADYVACNLLEATAPEMLIAEAFAQRPDLSLLVCSAGSIFDGPYLNMSVEDWDRTMNLNARSTYFVIQAFARRLAEAKRPGAVVIVSSTNAYLTENETTAYDASKAALVMMTRSLAHALSDFNIRVNGIAPGLIYTPLTAWLKKEDVRRRHYERKISLHRIGEPDDCAGAAIFLLSQAASYITGQVITVDGGLTLTQIGPV